MQLYKIVRSYNPRLDKDDEIILTGLSLEEAQAHCKDPDTRLAGEWFDGYSEDDSRAYKKNSLHNALIHLYKRG